MADAASTGTARAAVLVEEEETMVGSVGHILHSTFADLYGGSPPPGSKPVARAVAKASGQSTGVCCREALLEAIAAPRVMPSQLWQCMFVGCDCISPLTPVTTALSSLILVSQSRELGRTTSQKTRQPSWLRSMRILSVSRHPRRPLRLAWRRQQIWRWSKTTVCEPRHDLADLCSARRCL